MIEVSIHGGLMVASEFPENSFSIALVDPAGNQFVVYGLPVREWYALRAALPRSAGYKMFVPPSGKTIRDHAEADAYAKEIYETEIAKANAAVPTAAIAAE